MNIEYADIDRSLKFKNEKMAEDAWGEETHFVYIKYIAKGKTDDVKLVREFGYSIRRKPGAKEFTIHRARRITKKEEHKKDIVDEFIMRRTLQISGPFTEFMQINNAIVKSFNEVSDAEGSELEIKRFYKRGEE